MTARKANTPTLTRNQIVSAAMTIVDRDGLGALTMRKLAGDLGVGTMSLYYHVPDKSALYDLILDAGLGEVDLSADDPSAPVEKRVLMIANAFRDALLNHPRAAIIAMSRSLRTPTQMRPVEKLLQILSDAGMAPVQAMQTANILGQYAVGVTAMHANHVGETEFADEREGDYSELTPEEFPMMFSLMEHAEEFGDWNADFEAGLSALIKGLVTDKL